MPPAKRALHHLIMELAEMDGEDRGAILAELAPSHRARVETLLRVYRGEHMPVDMARATGRMRSEFVEARLTGAVSELITPFTRSALLAVSDGVQPSAVEASRVGSPSLGGRVLNLLLRRRGE